MAEQDTAGGPLVGFRSKTELVYQRLYAAIQSGRLRPGERVVADALARELRISKIPIREALAKLESQGLIVQSSHAGARVTPLSLHEMRGVYLLREEIEGLAARLAAQRVERSALDELADLHEQMAQHTAAGVLEPLSELNRRFHLRIAEATTYTTLADVTESTLRQVHRYRAAITRSASDWASAMEEHAEILRALEARDQHRAEGAARRHVAHQLEVELDAELALDMFVDGDTEDRTGR